MGGGPSGLHAPWGRVWRQTLGEADAVTSDAGDRDARLVLGSLAEPFAQLPRRFDIVRSSQVGSIFCCGTVSTRIRKITRVTVEVVT